jgi:L-ascorbate metabolism protein UlaG (beta-lactamase superfamily)
MAGTTGAVRQWPRSFTSQLTARPPGVGDALRVLATGGFRGSTEGVDRIPVRPAPLPALPPGAASVSWIGHASFLLRIGGATVLVDPVLSTRISGAGRRLTPPGLDALPPVDVLLISHNHYDHLDAPTVRRLPRDTRVVVPGGLGRWFRRRGFTAITELDWWESAAVGELTVDLVPANHYSRRGPFDNCATLWGSWVLTAGNGLRLYHGGDSGYGPLFSRIGARYPGIDVAMLQVGAYNPRWFTRTVHADPEEAVQAAGDLGAAAMVPMHWGTFQLSREPVLEPLQRTRAAWSAAGHDRAQLWDLAIGQTRVLAPPE